MLVTQTLRAKVTLVGIGILLVMGMSSCGGGSSSTSQVPPAKNSVPSLISFSPFNATAGAAGFSLTLTGSGFAPNATVTWDGNALATTFVNGNQLTAQVTAGDIAAPGIAQITVSNPTPGGGVSNVFRFGVNPASPPANFLYAANVSGNLGTPNTISGYSIDPNSGALTALAGSPFTPSPYPSATNPGPMGMDRLGKFLYVANAPAPNTSPSCQSCTTFEGFTPNSSGDLVPLAGSPLFTVVPNAFVGDPTANILYDSGGPGASQGSDIVTMAIDANTGALAPIADSPGFGVFIAIALNPAGTFLYGAGNPFISSSPGGIWTGSVNLQTGTVTVVATPTTQGGLGAQALAVHPSGKFLFAVGGATLFAYAIDPTTGELMLLNSISYSSIIGETLTDIVVHPSGQFLYTNLSVFNELLGFLIDGNGNLTPLPGSPFGTVAAPWVPGHGSGRQISLRDRQRLSRRPCRRVYSGRQQRRTDANGRFSVSRRRWA
jgi:6-phosphogluconolactonase (cycloisomerase 2 family)